MSINTAKYLDEVTSGFQKTMDEVKALCDPLEEKELNTPEGPGRWSMLQCLEHINLANEFYVKNIETKLEAETLPPASDMYRGHWKGRIFAKMNAPKPGDEIPMKIKTFKTMDPKPSLEKAFILDRFYDTHESLIEVIEKTRAINIDKVKIATALGPMVKLRIGEAYRFILAHTQRHMVQLRRIKSTVTD